LPCDNYCHPVPVSTNFDAVGDPIISASYLPSLIGTFVAYSTMQKKWNGKVIDASQSQKKWIKDQGGIQHEKSKRFYAG
jgi:hypothetical protein